MYDLLILGAGPAGMTAAVYAARQKAKTLLLSKDVGGQMNWTLGVENYMGYQFIESFELIHKFEEQVRQFPIDMKVDQEISGFSITDNGFKAEISGDVSFEGKTAIICTGKRPRTLGVPGEERFRGRGVTYCSVCDAPLFAGMNVAVIGGGNSALEAADDLRKIAQHVHLVSLMPLTAHRILVEKIREAKNVSVFTGHETLEIMGDNTASRIRIRDLSAGRDRELDVSGVFVEIGLIPNSHIFKDAVSLNELGEIRINGACETGTPGLFAAGDVTNIPAKQIVVAAGEGAKAALQAHQYLQQFVETGDLA